MRGHFTIPFFAHFLDLSTLILVHDWMIANRKIPIDLSTLRGFPLMHRSIREQFSQDASFFSDDFDIWINMRWRHFQRIRYWTWHQTVNVISLFWGFADIFLKKPLSLESTELFSLKRFSHDLNSWFFLSKTFHDLQYSGGARGVVVVLTVNKLGDLSSNPFAFHFAQMPLEKAWIHLFLSHSND